MKQEILEGILTKAILAPSADNMQPWKFAFRENRIFLYLDREKAKGFAGTAQLMPYASIGAVLENIRVASLYYGYQAQAVYFPDKDNPDLSASIVFKETSPMLHPHYSSLHERSTNRRFYDPQRTVSSVVYESMTCMAENEGFKLHWVYRADPNFQKLKKIMGLADKLRFEVKRLHHEFIECLRFRDDAKDGLGISVLEAGFGAEGLFHTLSDWGRMKFLNLLGLSRMINLQTSRQLDSSQAIGFLAGISQDPETYVRGGEVMQKLWHEMTVEGLAMQPMEALPIFILNLQHGEDQDFSSSQLKNLLEWKREFFSIFGITDENALLMMWRMGYAEKSRFRTNRRPLASFWYPSEAGK